MSYDYEHVTFDQFDVPAELHCIRCHVVIGRRTIVKNATGGQGEVLAVAKGATYKEVQVELSDGSVAYLPICKDCKKQPLDYVRALDVVKRTWKAEAEHQGRPQEAIKALEARTKNLKIVKSEASDARNL